MWSAQAVHDSKIDHTHAIYPPCMEPEARNSAVGWHWNTHTLPMLYVLYMGGSRGDVGEAMCRKGWMMRCDVAETTEGALLILQLLHRIASPMSQALHLYHLASRPWYYIPKLTD